VPLERVAEVRRTRAALDEVRARWGLLPGRRPARRAPGGFGEELISQVPLVETVPGAPDASVRRISVKVGSATEQKGKPIYHGMLPAACPKAGFTVARN